jgi:hypothetical protein
VQMPLPPSNHTFFPTLLPKDPVQISLTCIWKDNCCTVHARNKELIKYSLCLLGTHWLGMQQNSKQTIRTKWSGRGLHWYFENRGNYWFSLNFGETFWRRWPLYCHIELLLWVCLLLYCPWYPPGKTTPWPTSHLIFVYQSLSQHRNSQ